VNGAEPQEKRPLILVVEDDTSIRELVKETLEHFQFAVVEARNGADGVAAFAAHKPEIVLMDVRMPVMDGFEATAALRRLPGAATTPILILTGLDDTDSIRRAYESGATDFASKPINLFVLGHRVRYMLRAKRALDDLRGSEARLASAQRIARLGNWERQIKSGRMQWSEEMFRIFGVDPKTFTPNLQTYLDLIHPQDRDLVARATGDAVRKEGPYSFDARIVMPDGTVCFVHEQAEVVFEDDGTPLRLEGTTQDITERKQIEDQIRFLAYYDGLTRLPNRALFMERLNQSLASAQRQGRTVAMLFLDLDRFKRINDTLGHTVGDRLLQAVSERLKKCLRSTDTIARGDPLASTDSVARLGGDEFIVTISDIARGEDAARIARRILESMAEPFKLEEHEVFVTGSIGISLFPHDGADVETLLKNADSAMYHAKDAGRGSYQFYNKSMNASAFQRLALENAMRKALEREEFMLYYQPQVDVTTGAIFGAEALIRWKHPDLGMVSPADFIPLAEETGLILPIGEWVVRTAAAQGKAWQDAGHGPLIVAVNLSGRQFRQQQLVDTVGEALKATGFDPRCLELEITESILVQSVEDTIATLKRLRGMGPRISIDDFGTGYSSLTYLKRFPIDTLKIDQSFTRDIGTDPGDAAITAAIIAMAEGLKMAVIAEGVETEEQRDCLLQRRCRLMQGYLFSKPVPADQFRILLEKQAAGQKLSIDPPARRRRASG
jgi:diguanylate cyclase (GGDEF)-like protein/PAS domain S-box-containing protein